jgi:ubiquinone biosynthesis protein
MNYLALLKRRGELARFRHVLAILFRYGFGYLIYELKIGEQLPFVKRLLKKTEEEGKPLTVGERLRLAFEELGPTFIKFGQLLSNRPDLIPPQVVRELSKLQDHVPSFPLEQARAIIGEELGKPPEEIFADFFPVPIAAASIAQVYRASLHGGEKVAVKVQRPGVREQIDMDLNILEALARGLERYVPQSRAFYPVDLVGLFRKSITRELDFITEARNAERFRHNFSGSEDIYVPKVYWKLTTGRVLVMEDVEGVKVDDIERLRAIGIDLEEVARRGARAFLKQVFVDRFFHADPHPGNFSILPDGRLALVDYGIVGRLDSDLLEELSRLLLAIAEWDSKKAARHLMRMSTTDEEVDEDSLRSDLAYLIEGYAGRPLKDIHMGQVINEIVYIAARYRVRLPADLVLLGKAIVTMEGVGRRLDPNFDMVAVSRDFAKRYLLSRFKPEHIRERLEEMASDLVYLFRELPGEMQQIFKKITKGRLKIEFEHRGLETFISEMDKSSNRLTFGLIIAALIIGSSLITLSDKGPHFLGMPFLGALGYVMAGLLGLWLILGIIRSGRL